MLAEPLESRNPGRVDEIGLMIGRTPLVPVREMIQSDRVELRAKLEWQQFGGSVKSRPAFNIIKDAIATNQLNRSKEILDASSGNTALAYASIGAALGIKTTICLPENASRARINLLKALGSQIRFSSPFGGTDEAQEMARDLFENDPDRFFYADQYSNDNNWKAHYMGTGQEIWEQTRGNITHFVCGIGTAGSITGIARKLKEQDPGIRIIALQPDSEMHIMEGWKHLPSCRIPAIYDPFVIDEVVQISSEECLRTLKNLASGSGFILSPSSAANLAGANKVAESLDTGSVVTLFPDNGEKYMDVIEELF